MPLSFAHQVIDAAPPGSELDITLLTDLTGNGLPDIIIGGKQGDPNLFWYENPGWARHAMATVTNLEAGGAVLDVDGDGCLDIIAGEQWNGQQLFWFRNPGDPRQPWTAHRITDRYFKYHDQLIADIDTDGEPELVFCSQRAGILAYYDIPDKPLVSPWPDSHFHMISEGMQDVEGLVLADLDGPGQPVLIAGTNLFRRSAKGWDHQTYAPGFSMTRVAVGDLDGDGCLEIVLSEGESDPAKLAVCHGPNYDASIIDGGLFHPHSLELADFDGNGALDIFVGEMGLTNHADPRLIIFRNDGTGSLTPEVVSVGIPVHEAKVADMDGDGRPDIVGKGYSVPRIDLWLNRTGNA